MSKSETCSRIVYSIVIGILNASLVSIFGVFFNQQPEWKNYNPDAFTIAGLVLNIISSVIKFIETIIDLVKYCNKNCGSTDKDSKECLCCLQGTLFLVVYIGNIVMLVFNSIFLSDLSESQDKTFLIVSCVLFAILCLMQSILLLYRICVCCCDEGDHKSEKDPLLQ